MLNRITEMKMSRMDLAKLEDQLKTLADAQIQVKTFVSGQHLVSLHWEGPNEPYIIGIEKLPDPKMSPRPVMRGEPLITFDGGRVAPATQGANAALDAFTRGLREKEQRVVEAAVEDHKGGCAPESCGGSSLDPCKLANAIEAYLEYIRKPTVQMYSEKTIGRAL